MEAIKEKGSNSPNEKSDGKKIATPIACSFSRRIMQDWH